jgi:Fe2+ or Zn2+ uptake regulation protein
MQRHTQQRAAILQVLAVGQKHPTAQQIHQAAKRMMPRLSLGTVYRLLADMEQEGLIVSLSMPNSPTRYDANPGAHHHILCVRCGRVLDVPELVAPGAKGEIGRWTGYTVFGLSAVWYGLCKECAAAADEPLADTNASDS